VNLAEYWHSNGVPSFGYSTYSGHGSVLENRLSNDNKNIIKLWWNLSWSSYSYIIETFYQGAYGDFSKGGL